MKYAIVDLAGLFFRCKFVAGKREATDMKIGLAMHLVMASVNQVYRKFEVDHVVFALEGRSWRKDFYKPYKANRAALRAAMTEAEKEENELFAEAHGELVEYLSTKTNTSVLQCGTAEADDIIARFIHLHPDDEHFIISSDSDFFQLINENVKQYDGMAKHLITSDGYFDDYGKPVKDKKTKEHKTLGDPEYVLFKKCIRGDTSDNVFSAFPGVREKGTKTKVGITEAFEDRDKMGFKWNNLMLQTWTDHNDVKHRVKDDYERNRTLIDLNMQPDEIKDAVDMAIVSGVKTDKVPSSGIHFLKFCGRYELTAISKDCNSYTKWICAPYTGHLTDIHEELKASQTESVNPYINEEDLF